MAQAPALSGISEKAFLLANNKSEGAMTFKPKKNNFEWIEPPRSSIGYLFPTEETYHPLISTTNSEITSYLFRIDGSSLDDEKKTEYRNKVRNIVEKSVFIKSRSMLFIFLIISIIVLLIALFTKSSKVFMVFGGIVILSILQGLYTYIFADLAGRTIWINYDADYNARLDAGGAPIDILNKYIEEEAANRRNREMVNAMMVLANRNNIKR